MTELRLERMAFRTTLAILLTLSNNCALLSTEPDLPQEASDPSAQAAVSNPNVDPENEDQRIQRQLQHKRDIQRALDSGEIIVGMNMDEVLSVWGYPRDVEFAGNAQSGNQRWTYNEAPTRRWQLKPSRVIYFEEGRVVGWENAQPR